MTDPATTDPATIGGQYPPAGQCVPLVMLGSATLADLNRWTAAALPGFEYLPLAGIAFGEAVIAPWASAKELRLTGRMAVWGYALDDHVEREVTEPDELDAFFDRCNAVVRTGNRDDGHPLLAALSTWQQEIAALPGYPALAHVWQEKFASCLRGHRYDWVVGRARERGEAPDPDVGEYLDHADSSAVGQVQVPRWIVYGGEELPARLDVLVPALDDISVATRLANDLSTIARERDEPGANNVLMYGVSEDWVRDEIAGRVAAVRQRLAPLAEENFLPAAGLVRYAEWCVGIYTRNDMRLATAMAQTAERTGVRIP
jgi:hypothetical protein